MTPGDSARLTRLLLNESRSCSGDRPLSKWSRRRSAFRTSQSTSTRPLRTCQSVSIFSWSFRGAVATMAPTPSASNRDLESALTGAVVEFSPPRDRRSVAAAVVYSSSGTGTPRARRAKRIWTVSGQGATTPPWGATPDVPGEAPGQGGCGARQTFGDGRVEPPIDRIGAVVGRSWAAPRAVPSPHNRAPASSVRVPPNAG